MAKYQRPTFTVHEAQRGKTMSIKSVKSAKKVVASNKKALGSAKATIGQAPGDEIFGAKPFAK